MTETQLGTYPFGEPLRVVRWQRPGRRRAFVLGVYPSAFHACWHSPEGKQISPALAVADEPEPLWDGTGNEEVLERVAQRLPGEAGTLRAAGEHNGRAGRTLNEDYFEPLGLTRDEVWIADIQNYSLASADQVERLDASYVPLVDAGLVLPAAIILRATRPSIDRLAEDRDPPLEAEWDEASPDWLITLGDEPVRVLGLVDLHEGEYGEPRHATVFGRDVAHLALVHTRQAGRHGAHSPMWHERHQQWVRRMRDDAPAWIEDLLS
jgi:hypothetical protein